jgi:hypothetical protein
MIEPAFARPVSGRTPFRRHSALLRFCNRYRFAAVRWPASGPRRTCFASTGGPRPKIRSRRAATGLREAAANHVPNRQDRDVERAKNSVVDSLLFRCPGRGVPGALCPETSTTERTGETSPLAEGRRGTRPAMSSAQPLEQSTDRLDPTLHTGVRRIRHSLQNRCGASSASPGRTPSGFDVSPALLRGVRTEPGPSSRAPLPQGERTGLLL